VSIEEGPVKKQGALGVLRSVYCRDPDGSLVEISSYEQGARD
jgi:catechol 2,3-dioxygenase-like lactoylglutathione lyase family enzyme